MTPKQKFEARATRWEQDGRDASHEVTGLELVLQHCWIHSEGGKADGASTLLLEYDGACRKASGYGGFGGWFDDLMMERGHCHACGESYRLENLALCTDCDNTYCTWCKLKFLKVENGNHAHSDICDGELVG